MTWLRIDDTFAQHPKVLRLLSADGGSESLALWLAADVFVKTDDADRVVAWRDAGRPCAAFLIGGADGLDPDLVARADTVLSLGPMVWPHMLARAMLAEQLYRSVTILAGSPYHRA